MTVHADTPIIKALVETRFLYDMDPEIIGLTDCRIIAVSSYPGHALTFDIWLPHNGGCFCYTPIHLLRTKKEITSNYSLETLNIKNCPDEAIGVSILNFLKERKVSVELHLKNSERLWTEGTYLFSVDWYNKNELFNVIALDSGQLCAQPHYRVLFDGGVTENHKQLPPYKKLQAEWRINP